MFTHSKHQGQVIQSNKVNPVRLTRRELEILGYVARGQKSQDIADHLCVSKRTVDFHIAGIFKKLDVCNRISALRTASTYGFLVD